MHNVAAIFRLSEQFASCWLARYSKIARMKKYLVDDGSVQKKIGARSRREAATKYTATMEEGLALVAVQQVNNNGEEVRSPEWFPLRGKFWSKPFSPYDLN